MFYFIAQTKLGKQGIQNSKSERKTPTAFDITNSILHKMLHFESIKFRNFCANEVEARPMYNMVPRIKPIRLTKQMVDNHLFRNQTKSNKF